MPDKIQNQNFEIVVDDGFRKIPVKNIYGDEIGVFYFNPTDIGIIRRYNALTDQFEKITEPLEAEPADGMSAEEKEQFLVECYDEATERLYAACNELFGGDFAEAFFGKTDPWSPSNGKFYCETALEMVGAFISKQFDTEVDKINDRVKAYTNRAQRRAAKRK